MVIKSHLGTRGQPEQSRQAILNAALLEFAHQGAAGARINSIAQAAGVNKSLLYYYFKDKDGLFGATLEYAFQRILVRMREVLDRDLPVPEKLMAFVGAHFDYVVMNPWHSPLMQYELMRAGRAGSDHLERIVAEYMRPAFSRVAALLAEGVKQGKFRDVAPQQFLVSMLGTIIFYFISTPVFRAFSNSDPLAKAALIVRRAAVLDFIAAAIFRSPAEARRVLALPHIAHPGFLTDKAVGKRPATPSIVTAGKNAAEKNKRGKRK